MDIPEIMRTTKVIAVVGLSDNPGRPSYNIAYYLSEQGYAIIPVNPNISEWRGIKAYKTLQEIPQPIRSRIDVVDIFRKSEDVPPIVDEAIEIRAKTVWMQVGIVNEEAAAKARAAGLNVVMDRCMKIEHRKLNGL